MALKRKKLDAICAHLKKTSAVEVDTTTQNGITVGGKGDDAAVAVAAATRDSVGGEVGVVGSSADKPTFITNNNNEKTVTDLNENQEFASLSPSSPSSAAAVDVRDPSNNNEKHYDSSAKSHLQTGEEPSEEPSPAVPISAKSTEDLSSNLPPVTGDGNDNSIIAIDHKASSIPISALETSKTPCSDKPAPEASTNPMPTSSSSPMPPANPTVPASLLASASHGRIQLHGSGRRKSRKAAKPRSVFFQSQQEPVVNLDQYTRDGRQEDGNAIDIDGDEEEMSSSSFLFTNVVGKDHNKDNIVNNFSEEPLHLDDDSLSRESDGKQCSPVSNHFASQYSLQQQKKRHKQLPKQQQLNESVPNFLYPAPSEDSSPINPVSAAGSGFAPLDLSTSKISDANSECLSAADLSLFNHEDNDDNNNEDDDALSAAVADSSVSSPSTAASSPTPVHHHHLQPSPMVVNAEAKVLADYAKNTMNELLSIYGFGAHSSGGEGLVDKQLAQKQLENLSSLRALAAASTQGSTTSKAALIPSAEASTSTTPVPPPAHSGSAGERNAVKLSNSNRHSTLKNVGSKLSSSDGLSSSGSSSLGYISPNNSGQLKKPGGPTKYKFHNVKPPKEHVESGGASTSSLPKVSSADYNKYIKKFHSGAACGGSHCLDLGYRDHYHCHDCNFKVFIKKEEMVRHYKWHKKRDESLQHGFLRYSPLDDCGVKYSNCAHNKRQTHYHCIQPGCDKVYISTSDVQMHANYHRKDSAIIQEGFQRFRATEDCGTTTCGFYGQRTTHFHCRRSNCNFTFKNKADMEKHKSYHQKDEILGRDGFKKFMKYEHCSFQSCRFSKVSNHIHCIRPGCSYVLHSTAQLYSHKRKHERREFENLYRTFRQAQRPQMQPASVTTVPQVNPQLQAQTQTRHLAPSVAGVSSASPAVPVGSKVSVPTLPLYGEPMVSPLVPGQVLQQSVQVPIKLGAAGIPTASRVPSATNTQKTSSMVQAATLALSQPLSLTKTPPTASQTGGDSSTHIQVQNSDNPPSPAIRIKQEPQSDVDEQSDAESLSTSLALNTPAGSSSSSSTVLPCSLDKVKSEELNDSLNLSIPGGQKVGKVELEELNKQVMLKSSAESGSATSTAVGTADGIGSIGNGSGKSGHITMTLLPPMKKQGVPEKRERDETWKNYLIRYTANDPCHSRCLLLYKDHYHCKIPGCQVLFRSKDGVREHAKFHDLQDRITPMVYNRYDSTNPCSLSTCHLSQKQAHFHCNWTGCSHVIPEVGQTFARLEHYRIHEYAKAAAGKNYRMQSGTGALYRMDDLANRRRGRPPKYPRLDVPSVPKVELTESEIQESSKRMLDGEVTGTNEKVINGFRKFEEDEECPNDQCAYRNKVHYHCGRPRCHTATDRIDVLNLHAKDFHNFVRILDNFEFFDRNVSCRRSHCSNNGTNRHYHCTRPRCDYSFVRHSTMTQHDKKHTDGERQASSSSSSASLPTSPPGSTPLSPTSHRITPIHLLRRPDGQTYIPIVPAPSPGAAALVDKSSVVKASGTFYPLSGLPTVVSVSGAPITMVTSTGGGQVPPSSGLTLTIPSGGLAAGAGGIPVMTNVASLATASASTANIVPVLAGNIISGAGTIVNTSSSSGNQGPPLTVLLQQKSSGLNNNTSGGVSSNSGVVGGVSVSGCVTAPQASSWSTMRSSMHYSLQASCGRPFCKLKKKDHYHCLECNQAFSDPARLRGHISKHGVKFRKLAQQQALSGAAGNSVTAAVLPPSYIPVAAVKSLSPSQLPLPSALVGLDLSSPAKLRAAERGGKETLKTNDDGEKDVIREEDGDEQDDDNDSLSSSLNLSIGKIAATSVMTRGGNGGYNYSSKSNDESCSSLIIDEEAEDHSDDDSESGTKLVADDSNRRVKKNEDRGNDEAEEENADERSASASEEISLNDSTLATSSPTLTLSSSSRRSGRKRSAPKHSNDFVLSDDASLLAKQMKLKLSSPIPCSTPVPIPPAPNASTTPRNVPEGFIRFHCSSDCGYLRCSYRQSVTHFHCLRPECGYGFSDKSRILQHQFRHERIDKLMGDEFQQFRATVRCGRGQGEGGEGCEFSEKASHFHCQKCTFVCADSSKVLAHRKYHAKMDNIANNGFQKFGALQSCEAPMCAYSRKQTHYHCTHDGCNHAVLGPAQMAPHKLKHASHDV